MGLGLIARSAYANSRYGVVRPAEPKMLTGSYCSGCGGRVLLRHEPKTLPAYGEDLTYRVNEVEQGKSTLLP